MGRGLDLGGWAPLWVGILWSVGPGWVAAGFWARKETQPFLYNGVAFSCAGSGS